MSRSMVFSAAAQRTFEIEEVEKKLGAGQLVRVQGTDVILTPDELDRLETDQNIRHQLTLKPNGQPVATMFVADNLCQEIALYKVPEPT